jgi:hypothetical protein
MIVFFMPAVALLHWPGRVGVPVVVEGEVDGTVGTTVAVLGSEPVLGNTLIVGTAAAELTPRFPISVEPKGMPVPAMPVDVVGDVDV